MHLYCSQRGAWHLPQHRCKQRDQACGGSFLGQESILTDLTTVFNRRGLLNGGVILHQ